MPHGSTAAPCAALSNARLDALSGGQRRMEVFDWMGERMLMSAVACCGIVAARGTWNRDLTQDSDGSSLPCARGDLVAAAGEWERRRLGVAIKPSQASGNATGTVSTRESLICNKLATHGHSGARFIALQLGAGGGGWYGLDHEYQRPSRTPTRQTNPLCWRPGALGINQTCGAVRALDQGPAVQAVLRRSEGRTRVRPSADRGPQNQIGMREPTWGRVPLAGSCAVFCMEPN